MDDCYRRVAAPLVALANRGLTPTAKGCHRFAIEIPSRPAASAVSCGRFVIDVPSRGVASAVSCGRQPADPAHLTRAAAKRRQQPMG